jgi:hypothetical protein
MFLIVTHSHYHTNTRPSRKQPRRENNLAIYLTAIRVYSHIMEAVVLRELLTGIIGQEQLGAEVRLKIH